MGMKFKKGDNVTQIVTPIVGVVTRAHIVDDDSVEYFVGYTGEDGEVHERSFKEDQIAASATPAVDEDATKA